MHARIRVTPRAVSMHDAFPAPHVSRAKSSSCSFLRALFGVSFLDIKGNPNMNKIKL
jgi:hypothetical protein